VENIRSTAERAVNQARTGTENATGGTL
jgi:hypothetical protein